MTSTSTHFVSASCKGEYCSVCARAVGYAIIQANDDSLPAINHATHKVGEEIPDDDPLPHRHNLTAYLCCSHFRNLFGTATGCCS